MIKKTIFIFSLIHCIPHLHAEFEQLKFHNTFATFNKIRDLISRQQKGAYVRFGDGEVNIAIGGGNNEQPINAQLTVEMREAMAINEPMYLKTLPLYCKELGGYEPGMYPGNHEAPLEWCVDILDKAKRYWNGPFTDVYSHVALHFAATIYQEECIQFLKFVKQSNCFVLVGNEHIPQELRTLFFGEKCLFIPTPATNSYRVINAVEKQCLELIPHDQKYKVIVTAMGAPGKVLQKRLWKKFDNVFFFDFGSLLDALSGWNTRAWIDLTKFNHEQFIAAFKHPSKEIA